MTAAWAPLGFRRAVRDPDGSFHSCLLFRFSSFFETPYLLFKAFTHATSLGTELRRKCAGNFLHVREEMGKLGSTSASSSLRWRRFRGVRYQRGLAGYFEPGTPEATRNHKSLPSNTCVFFARIALRKSCLRIALEKAFPTCKRRVFPAERRAQTKALARPCRDLQN